jgi:hypothetical protein
VLAYISWHSPRREVDPAAYEQALVRLHRSLEHRPPSGFRGSAAFRAEELPWIASSVGVGEGGAGYEDWYLVDGWAALGVLEEAAVARGHVTRHDAVAGMAGVTSGGVYRLSEGHPALGESRVGVWIARAPGCSPVTIGDLLGDGMDRQRAGLWRRCLGLGPAPEYCLLAPEVPPGVAATRLPAGWRASAGSRELLFSG